MEELGPRFVFCSAPKMSKQSPRTEMLFDMALKLLGTDLAGQQHAFPAFIHFGIPTYSRFIRR